MTTGRINQVAFPRKFRRQRVPPIDRLLLAQHYAFRVCERVTHSRRKRFTAYHSLQAASVTLYSLSLYRTRSLHVCFPHIHVCTVFVPFALSQRSLYRLLPVSQRLHRMQYRLCGQTPFKHIKCQLTFSQLTKLRTNFYYSYDQTYMLADSNNTMVRTPYND